MNCKQILEQAYPVMPVVEISNADLAKPLADALISSGVNSIEITLRTSEGQRAIAALSGYNDKLMVGAGTVTNREQLAMLADLGVTFIISPGFSPTLAEEAVKLGVNWIPGVSTGSEIMQGMEFGLDAFKLFPAESAGGINTLKALRGPFANIAFCPTGGVNKNNMNSYLELPNVLCVGGSWIAPSKHIDSENWNEISALAKQALESARLKNTFKVTKVASPEPQPRGV